MYMLNSDEYKEEKTHQALDMLYVDRRNEFRELSLVLLNERALQAMPHWKEFVLNFCLDVEEAFKTWSGQNSLSIKSTHLLLNILSLLFQSNIVRIRDKSLGYSFLCLCSVCSLQ